MGSTVRMNSRDVKKTENCYYLAVDINSSVGAYRGNLVSLGVEGGEEGK